MNAITLLITALLVFALAYRFYGVFIAAKVLAFNDNNETPAHRLTDGRDYHPTNKWVLFGHHFAAISGAGPLVGPVLAAQFVGHLDGQPSKRFLRRINQQPMADFTRILGNARLRRHDHGPVGSFVGQRIG